MKNKIILFFFLAVPSFLLAQTASDRINLFIDCQMNCDFTFIKQEIQFVNYMQNRQEADIYVLATRQRTGAGGREVQLVFIGENNFSKLRDTLIYFTGPNATDAIEREQMVQELKHGLLPFVVQSNLVSQIDYSITIEEGSDDSTSTKDPWNYWVFNIGGNAWLEAESSFNAYSLSGRMNISRITDKHKFELFGRYNYNKSSFELTDGEKFSSVVKRYNANTEYVRSLGPKWSIGFTSRVGSSSFNNTEISASLKPAIEYNLYPYAEASTRRFSFLYSVGPEYNNYADTTIYNKTSETVMRHGLEIEFEQTQKWGNINIDLGFNQYLHDFELYSIYINPNLEWQVFKGFSIDLGGYASFVNDRINIAKADISDEDILLQIKQLDTEFTYFIYSGINYRFGSSFNNVVNQRF